MANRFHVARTTLGRDPAYLPIRDRAVLRIINRAGSATSAQLAILAYGNLRHAQRRLTRMWRWGLLERSAQPPKESQAGAPYAYRLSRACLRRLGYRRPAWRGPGYLEHALDAVDAVCGLVAASPRGQLVQLWLPDRLTRTVLEPGPGPDAIVVMSSDSGSAVVCLEIDESTQHAAPIRDKLSAQQHK